MPHMEGIFINGEKAKFHPEDILDTDASQYTEEIGESVTAYLTEHITNPSNPPIDTSLSIAGAAADAKKTGDEISQLKSEFTDINAELADLRVGAGGRTYNSAGAAVRGQISDLKTTLNSTQNDLESLGDGLIVETETKITDLTVHSGYRYDGSGTLVSVTPSIGTAEAVEIPVTAGQKIHWVCYYANQNSTYNVKYLMSDNSIVADTNYTTGGANEYTFVVPTNCVKLLVSCWVISNVGNTFYLVSKNITSAKSYTDTLVASTKTAIEADADKLYLDKVDGIVPEHPALFNPNNIITGYWYNTTTGAVASNSDRFIQPLVPCKPNTTYTKRTCNVCIYDSARNFISTVLWNGGNTFTTPANAAYLGVSMTTSILSFVRLIEANIPTGDIAQTSAQLSPSQIKTIVVSKDGVGEYNSLTKAIVSNSNKKVRIEVRAGEYDLFDEYEEYYGTGFFDDDSFSNEGLVINNGTEIIMDSLAVVKFNYTGENSRVTVYFSPFKFSGSGGILRGGQIICSNCRYAIHDDTYSSPHDKRIIDGVYIYYRSSRNVAIGGGLGYSSDVELKNCYVDSGAVGYGVFYHNSSYEGSQSMVKIHDNFFTAGIYIQPYGPSELVSKALVSNNKAPAVARITTSMTEDNFELIAWNNDTN